jgi:hypothetical protein
MRGRASIDTMDGDRRSPKSHFAIPAQSVVAMSPLPSKSVVHMHDAHLRRVSGPQGLPLRRCFILSFPPPCVLFWLPVRGGCLAPQGLALGRNSSP